MSEAITAALREHAEKIEQKAAADRAEINKLRNENGELAERLAGLEQEVAGQKAFGGRVESTPSPVTEFIKSAQLQAMRDGSPTTGRVSIKTSGLKLLSKAISNTGVGQAGDNAYSVPAERWVGLGNNPQPRLSLFDVLPSIPVTAGTFEYMQLNGYTNAAAVQVKEGDAKAEASMPTQVVTANICTIAHHLKASVQVLDDAPALSMQLDNLLRYGVLAKGESELVNGVGGTGKMKGLLSYATAFTPTSAEAQDMIGEAITELQANGWNPSAVILNAADWGAIQRARGTSNDGYLMGSPRDPAPPSLWSVPVITCASLAAGTAIVLDASQCALLDRQEITVATSREDGSNFTENMITVLGEGRMGLAVFSLGALLSVDLTPAST